MSQLQKKFGELTEHLLVIKQFLSKILKQNTYFLPIYKDKSARLTIDNTPNEFRAISTIEKNSSVRDVLGDYSQSARPKLSRKIETAAIAVSQTTPAEKNIELQNLGETKDRGSESLETLLEVETAFQPLQTRQNVGVGTDLQRQDVGVETDQRLMQNMRDLERTHQFIGTMSGQVKVSDAKISAFDEQITQLKNERDRLAFMSEDIVEDGRITEINEQLKDLKEQEIVNKNTLIETYCPGSDHSLHV